MTAFRASCFGKLPVHADFIRHNAGPEILSLDGLIGQGMGKVQKKLGAGWSQAYAAIPPLRFIRHFPDRKRFVVGIMIPSRGKANREFPFFVACAVDAGALRNRPAILALGCETFLQQAEALARSDWTGRSLRDVQAAVGALQAEFDPRGVGAQLDQLLASTSYGDMLAGLGDWDDRRMLLLHNMANLIGPRSRPKFTLVLPPCADAGQVSLWLDLVAASRGGVELFPQMTVWSAADPARGLRCSLLDPTPNFGALLMAHVPNDACLLYQEGLETASLLEKAKVRFGGLTRSPTVPASDVRASLQASS